MTDDNAALGHLGRCGSQWPALDDVLNTNRHIVDGGNHDLPNRADAAVLLAAEVGCRCGSRPDSGQTALLLWGEACRASERLRLLDFQAQDLLHRVESAADEADAADVQHRVALRKVVAADVVVAAGDGVLQLRQRNAVLLEPIRVPVNLIALNGHAVANYINNSRDPAEFPFQHPILQGLEIVGRVDRLLAAGKVPRVAEGVTKDFAGGRFRRNLRVDARRQVHDELQAVDDFLPGLVEIDAVIELVSQVRQPRERLAAAVFQARHPCQRNLQGNRDAALDFLSRAARILRNDLDDGGGGVRIRFDVDVRERIEATPGEDNGQKDDNE